MLQPTSGCRFSVAGTSIAPPFHYQSLVGNMSGLHGHGKPWPERGFARPTDPEFQYRRHERQQFKSISLYTVDLPETPIVVNIRCSSCYWHGWAEQGGSVLDDPVGQPLHIAPGTAAPRVCQCCEGRELNSVNSVFSTDTQPLSTASVRSAPIPSSTLTTTRPAPRRRHSRRIGRPRRHRRDRRPQRKEHELAMVEPSQYLDSLFPPGNPLDDNSELMFSHCGLQHSFPGDSFPSFNSNPLSDLPKLRFK